MRLDPIALGDIVKASIKGRTVYGEVRDVAEGVVRFDPLSPAAGWRHASAHEIHRALAQDRARHQRQRPGA